MTKFWLVGLFKAEDEEGEVYWEFVGIFDSEALGLDACRSEDHFIAPATMNEDIGDESEYFPECRYPLRERHD